MNNPKNEYGLSLRQMVSSNGDIMRLKVSWGPQIRMNFGILQRPVSTWSKHVSIAMVVIHRARSVTTNQNRCTCAQAGSDKWLSWRTSCRNSVSWNAWATNETLRADCKPTTPACNLGRIKLMTSCVTELLNGSQSGALLCHLLLVEPNDWHAEVTHPDIDIKLSHRLLSRILLQVWRGVCCAHATAVTDLLVYDK